MPYRNQLAPPSSNRLGDEVPSLDPMLMPPPYAPPQSLSGRLENLSIGLGYDKARGLEGLYQMVTQPRATAQAIAQFAREVSDDPGVVLEMLRQARQKAMSGELGLGELIGENVSVNNMLRRPKPPMQEITAHQASNQAAGLTRGLLYGGLGAPVDLANMALLGAGGQRPVGGSAWLEQKIDPLLSRFIGAPNSGQSAARFVGDVVAPGPGEFAAGSKALQGLLADPATATKIQQMVGGLLGMTAHHGSPHRFDKFELSNRTIGTGEGAQAYGHGLYFAESPDVANRYIYGRGSANDLLAHPEASPGALAHVRSAYMESDFDSPKQITKGWLLSVAENADDVTAKELSKIDPRKFSLAKGNLYTVDIPDEQIAKMLDWDKPLSQQPASVRKAIKALEPLAEDSDTGSDIYALIRSGLSGSHSEAQAAASEILRQAGIPGMRFLDAGSRNIGRKATVNGVPIDKFDPSDYELDLLLQKVEQGYPLKQIAEIAANQSPELARKWSALNIQIPQGTRNLVVFDDSIIKILSRE